MRLSVLNAVVWKAIAELFRRHCAHHRLYLGESHPGSSVRGRLHVRINPPNGTAFGGREVIFNLGGPSGTYDIRDGQGQLRLGGNFLALMLDGDPVDLLDTLDRALELRTPMPLPASTAQTLAVRLIAQVMAQEFLAKSPLRATMGWFDHNGEAGPLTWALIPDMPSGGTPKDLNAMASRAPYDPVSQRVAIHHAPDEAPLQSVDQAPIALVDIKSGLLHLVRGTSTVSSIDLTHAYQAADSRLGTEVARVLAHLGR